LFREAQKTCGFLSLPGRLSATQQMEGNIAMSKPTLNLDGRSVEFDPGQTILEVARQAGVYTIPTLCSMKHSKPTGSCRI
jgi:hypothetical protein